MITANDEPTERTAILHSSEKARIARKLVREAIELHHQWIDDHGTDDDPHEVYLDELLPEEALSLGNAVADALIDAGCQIVTEGDDLIVRLPGYEADA